MANGSFTLVNSSIICDSAIYYSHIAFHYIHFGLLRHFSYYSHSKYMQIFCVAKSLYFGLLPRAGSLIRLVAQSCERTYKTSMPLLARIMSMQLYPGIDQQQQRNPKYILETLFFLAATFWSIRQEVQKILSISYFLCRIFLSVDKTSPEFFCRIDKRSKISLSISYFFCHFDKKNRCFQVNKLYISHSFCF